MYKFLFTAASLLLAFPVQAAEYKIDPAHSFIEFEINHLGFSILHGRFNRLSGDFSYDSDQPNDSRIQLYIDPASVDTNHAERDKKLRSDDFLDVEKYPEASFSSTSFVSNDAGGTLTGILDMHGVSKEISIDVIKTGEGKDPWGNFRIGFSGTTELVRDDFDIGYDLGPAAKSMQFQFTIEGIRQK